MSKFQSTFFFFKKREWREEEGEGRKEEGIHPHKRVARIGIKRTTMDNKLIKKYNHAVPENLHRHAIEQPVSDFRAVAR